MIKKKDIIEQKTGECDIKLVQRLQTSIKLLLTENPVLPNVFNFNGKCLLHSLKKEAAHLGYEQSQTDFGSPSKQNIDILKVEKGFSTDSKVMALSPGADPFDVDSLQGDY